VGVIALVVVVIGLFAHATAIVVLFLLGAHARGEISYRRLLRALVRRN
jgi:hypothetical protein